MTTTHDRIRQARAIGCVSVAELARLSGLSRTHVQFLERESARPTGGAATTLAKIADALGVSLDWLVRGVGPEPRPRTVRAAVRAARARIEVST